MHKKLLVMLTVLALGTGAAGCSNVKQNTSQENTNQENTANTETNETTTPKDSVTSTEEATATIQLGDQITVDGTGVKVDGHMVTITNAGTYEITGTIQDGQIIVEAGDEDNVELILNEVNLTSQSSAPIYVKNVKNAYLILADGSENIITDTENYVLEDETNNEPNAAIFSKDDLIIKGTGSLTVNANYNNGIQSKDDLKIKSGSITVNAVNDALKGKDSITIEDGDITLVSGGDGMQSTNAEEEGRGYILIEGGVINITADLDGIQAETDLTINGGTLNIETGGTSANSSSSNSSWGQWGQMNPFPGESTTSTTEESTSAKALKAGNSITINDGMFAIDSSDDSLHSNNELVINGGTFELLSGDDGIHADTTLEINGGEINILKSYEGIESQTITINGGNIHLVASDDGINAAGGNDASSMGGRPGQNGFGASSNALIEINGGYIVIDATGDGIDSNGNINMTDGTVIVHGPTSGGDGALDYDGTFTQSGGLLIAAGSSGMVQTTSTSSTQNTVSVTLSSTQQANTLVHIESSSGDEVITFAPSKTFQNIVISSPSLKTGTTYTVSAGGTSTGTSTDGLYESGKYSGGTEAGSFTVSSSVSYVGSAGGQMSPGMGGQQGGMGGRK